MMRRVVLLLSMVVVAGRAAIAQDSLALGGLDRESATALARIVESARERGLPADPVIAKIAHGVLVHAPPPRIITAAQNVVARLEEARTALAPTPTAADIAAGGDALSVGGVTLAALRAVRSASPRQPVAVPLAVLAQLVASHVPADRATAIVTALIKRGASNEQLVALGNNVNSDVARGARAVASLDVRLQGLNAVLAPLGSATTTGDVTASSPTPKKP